jgi:hypothetical protein
MGTGKKFIIVLMMAVEEMIEMNVQEVLTRIISWKGQLAVFRTITHLM